MSKKKRINSIVVGSGFGGIASALRLRALGHNVTLIDRLPEIGGRAQVFNVKGFKHDAGPTVITAPFMFDELFSLFGENREKYLKFARHFLKILQIALTFNGIPRDSSKICVKNSSTTIGNLW